MPSASRRSLRVIALPVMLLTGLSGPAFGCDPDALWKEVRATCVDFVTAANAPVARVHQHLPASDRAELDALTLAAMASCDALQLDRAATLAARLALTIGRAEAALGLPPGPAGAALLPPAPRT